jgi:general secretion pathway protein C
MSAVLQHWLKHPAWRKYNLVMPHWLSALLLALIAYTAAQLTWLVLTPAPEAPRLMVRPPQNNVNPQQQTDFANQIANAHLFGTPDVAAPSEKPVDAPETRLNLKLSGVFAIEDESKGLALIASGSSPENMYLVGDQIPGNIVLSAVYPDRVLLKRGAQYETLRLPETQSTGLDYAPTRSAPASAPAEEEMEGSGEQNNLGQIRRDFLRNPTKLAELVQIAPVEEGGQTTGYRITALKDDPLFTELGLQSGDVVKRVNGIDLDSSAKGLQVLQQLRRAKQVLVTLDRNGQTIELNHSF